MNRPNPRLLLPACLCVALLSAAPGPARAASGNSNSISNLVRQLNARVARSVVTVEGVVPSSTWEYKAGRAVGIAVTDSALPRTPVGTGVILDASGLIVASGERIPGCTFYGVKLESGRTAVAEWIGYDRATGISVLRVKGAGPALPASPAAMAPEGEWVAVASRLRDGSLTVSLGTLGRSLSSKGSLATSAATGPLGGVLLDGEGRLLGLATSDVSVFGRFGGSSAEGAPYISHAWSREQVIAVSHGAHDSGLPDRGYLGLQPDVQPATNAAARPAVRVLRVVPGSPAALAGVKPGDLVVRINARAVADAAELSDRVTHTSPGAKLFLSWERGGAEMEKEVTVASVPTTESESFSADELFQNELRRFRGMLSSVGQKIRGR